MPNDRIKHIMYGAGLQIGTKTVSNVAWDYAQKQGMGNPAPWWYIPDGLGGLPFDDVVLDLGLPAALGIAGIAMKKQKLKDMALGAGLTGIATILHVFLSNTAKYPWLPFQASASAPQSDNSNVANTARQQGIIFAGETPAVRGRSSTGIAQTRPDMLIV
jgi:hypothetical protein